MERVGFDALQELDDLDTRREILYLLSRLSLPQRVAYLYWIVEVSNDPILRNAKVRVTQTTGSVYEVYGDLMVLVSTYNLPLQRILRGLEQFVSKGLIEE